MQDFRLMPWPTLMAALDDWTPDASSQSNPVHAPAWKEIHRRLLEFALLNLRSQVGLLEQDVDDVAQTVLLKLQRAVVWRRLRSSNSIVGYLHVMMKNQAIDLQRRRALEFDLPKATALEDIGDQRDRSTRELKRSLDWLDGAMRLLTPDERALLKMRFWKRLSFGEIAERLQIPYSTVSGRMFRIIKKLRMEWKLQAY